MELYKARDAALAQIGRAESAVENAIQAFEIDIDRKWSRISEFNDEDGQEDWFNDFEIFASNAYSDAIDAAMDALEDFGFASSEVESDIQDAFEEKLKEYNSDVAYWISWTH